MAVRVLSIDAALVRVSETFFHRNPVGMRVVLASVPDASEALRRFLDGYDAADSLAGCKPCGSGAGRGSGDLPKSAWPAAKDQSFRGVSRAARGRGPNVGARPSLT